MNTLKVSPVNQQEKKLLIRTLQEALSIDQPQLEVADLYIFNQEIDHQFLDFEVIEETIDFDFIVKDNEGQYNQKQDLLQKRLNNIFNLDTKVKVAKGYHFKNISESDLKRIKKYLINPVVEHETTLEQINFLDNDIDTTEHQVIEGFSHLNQIINLFLVQLKNQHN